MSITLQEYCLQHNRQDLLEQWHSEKNGDSTPDQVLPGSHKKVWWKCEKGHEWQAVIQSRARGGCNCPVCSNRIIISGENDLATHFPEIASQWNLERNGTFAPNMASPYSNKKVWWRCDAGHEYSAVIADRTSAKTDCPYCTGRKVLKGFNDFQTKEPLIAAQWHPTLNGELTPDQVTCGSHKIVWWQCSEGHTWKTPVYSRGCKKYGCPVCTGKIKG